MVGASAEMSYTPSSLTDTTDGPIELGAPDPAGEDTRRTVLRQRRRHRHLVTHRSSPPTSSARRPPRSPNRIIAK